MRISFLLLFILLLSSCRDNQKEQIISNVGESEYNRLMDLDIHGFDQTYEGFRQYSGNYQLTCLLIPEYIKVNKLTDEEAKNLHWHLGQIHAFNGNYKEAIAQMSQSYAGGSITWKCYVDGSIAFLKKDKEALAKALETLGKQDNIMNIEILEKFVKHFDKSYMEAYNMPY